MSILSISHDELTCFQNVFLSYRYRPIVGMLNVEYDKMTTGTYVACI